MPNRDTIQIPCATDTCPNYEVLAVDSRLPNHWLCSACQMALDEQEADAFAAYVQNTYKVPHEPKQSH